VTRELEGASAAVAAPLDQVKQSVQSDLQYVSLQENGRTYGGWYRVLPDGQMELLALANIHSERRAESSPIEQARGMLADFIRGGRSPTEGSAPINATNGSNASQVVAATKTLGDVLYADTSKSHISESDWVTLVQSIATGDQLALYRLFERTNRIVFTLIMRLTNDFELTEELTLDVFHWVWRESSVYDPSMGSVVGWIMDQARSRAIHGLRNKHLPNQPVTYERAARAVHGTHGPLDGSRRLQSALSDLTRVERELIESLFFSELSYDELAAESQRSSDTVRARIHAALEKLGLRLEAGAQEL
jgi:RNA polymerase sigma-70 factor, ECF subfamily